MSFYRNISYKYMLALYIQSSDNNPRGQPGGISEGCPDNISLELRLEAGPLRLRLRGLSSSAYTVYVRTYLDIQIAAQEVLPDLGSRLGL